MATREPRPTDQGSCFPDIPEPFVGSDARDRVDLGEYPLAPTADSRRAAAPPTARLPQSLDKLPLIEGKYGTDAGSEITQPDVEHLCKVWAAVGRAILSRRQRTNEQENLT